VHRDRPVPKDLKETRVYKVKLVLMVHKDRPVPKDLKETRGYKVKPVQRAHRALLVPKDLKETRVYKVQLVLKARRVLLVVPIVFLSIMQIRVVSLPRQVQVILYGIPLVKRMQPKSTCLI
jgi:hypothetical protein